MKNIQKYLVPSAVITAITVFLGLMVVVFTFVGTRGGTVLPSPDVGGAFVIFWMAETFRFQQFAVWAHSVVMSGRPAVYLAVGTLCYWTCQAVGKQFMAMRPWRKIIAVGALGALSLIVGGPSAIASSITLVLMLVVVIPDIKKRRQYPQ